MISITGFSHISIIMKHMEFIQIYLIKIGKLNENR
jgi:hypothetical protein